MLGLMGKTPQRLGGRLLRHRLDEHRVGVPERDDRDAREEVEVASPLGIPQVGALGACNEGRGASHGIEGAHGRVNAAGNHLACAFKQLDVFIDGHSGSEESSPDIVGQEASRGCQTRGTAAGCAVLCPGNRR